MTAWGSDSQRSETNRLRVPQGCRKACTSLSVILPFSHQRRFRINIPQKIKIEDVMLIQLSTVSKARHLFILTAIRVISNSTIMVFHQQAFFQMEDEQQQLAAEVMNGVVKVDVLTLRSTLAHHGYCLQISLSLHIKGHHWKCHRGVGIVKIEWISLRVSMLMMLNQAQI